MEGPTSGEELGVNVFIAQLSNDGTCWAERAGSVPDKIYPVGKSTLRHPRQEMTRKIKVVPEKTHDVFLFFLNC
jgi:hypothetical protein